MIKGISIGDFDFYVQFYVVSQTGTRDEFGGIVMQNGTAINAWANIKAKPQSYVLGNGEIEYKEELEVSVRQPLAISAGDKMAWDGKSYSIVNIISSDKTKLVLKAVRV